MDEVSLLIGGPDADHVRLDLRPAIEEPGEPDWSYNPAEISVRCGRFGGRFRTTILTREMARFVGELRTLHDRLSGVSSLELLEGTLRLSLTGDGRGGIAISGEATDDPGSERRLRFGFRIDQTYLPPVIAAAQALARA